MKISEGRWSITIPKAEVSVRVTDSWEPDIKPGQVSAKHTIVATITISASSGPERAELAKLLDKIGKR